MEMFTVGELSKKTGITIATLHHYDKEGLLVPKRTASGRRIYFNKDLLKLEQITLLKVMGFSLKDIKEQLLPAQNTAQIEALMEKQLQLIDGHIQVLQKNKEVITHLLNHMKENGHFEWQRCLFLIKQINMRNMNSWLIHFFGEEQLLLIEKKLGGRDQLLLATNTWHEMLNELFNFMIEGTPVIDEKVQALTKAFILRLEPFFGAEEFIQVLRMPANDFSVMLEEEMLPLHFEVLNRYFEKCIQTYLNNNNNNNNKTY